MEKEELQEICKYISEDNTLNNFFKTLNEYYKIVESVAIEEDDELKIVEKPTLEKIEEIIKKTEESGIIITKKELWLDEKSYTNEVITAPDLYYSVIYNGYHIDGRDISVFKSRIRYIEEGSHVHCLTSSEVRYEDWLKCKDFDLLNKKYEKELKKHIKKSEKKQKSIEKSQMLLDMEEELQFKNRLQKEAEFFENITEEQIRNILEAIQLITETKEQYKEYLSNKSAQEEYINKNKEELYQLAFIKMLEQNSIKPDIDNIVKKLFAIMIIVDMNPSEEELEETKFDFDKDVISWFCSFKVKELQKLYDKIFELNNFSLAVDTICNKMLKK